MSASDFYRQIGIGLVLALISASSAFLLVPTIGLVSFGAFAIPVITLIYLLLLFRQIRARTGQATLILFWSVLAAVIWILQLPLASTLVLHLGAVWLIRSVYLYRSVLGSLLDLLLCCLSLAMSLWCFYHTGSLFLSIWCLFLTQAFFVTIPTRFRRGGAVALNQATDKQKFDEAERNAVMALRRLNQQ